MYAPIGSDIDQYEHDNEEFRIDRKSTSIYSCWYKIQVNLF